MSSFDYEFTKIINIGRFSRIYRVKRLENDGTPRYYAAKLFFRLNHRSWKYIHREHYFLRRLSSAVRQSSFVVTLFQTAEFLEFPVFVMSEGCGKDLYDLLAKVGRMTEAEAKFFACEIICGLEHIHSLNIVHADIKPENILLTHSGHIMITDFDFACDLSEGGKSEYKVSPGGTHGYVAPELLRRIACNQKADIWSMAAVIADLVSPDRLKRVNKKKKLKPGEWDKRFLDNISLPFRLFFIHCFEENHKGRPSAEEIKQFEFFEDVDWRDVEALRLRPPFTFFNNRSPLLTSSSKNIDVDSIVGKKLGSNSNLMSPSLDDEFSKSLHRNPTTSRLPSPVFDDIGEFKVHKARTPSDCVVQKTGRWRLLLDGIWKRFIRPM